MSNSLSSQGKEQVTKGASVHWFKLRFCCDYGLVVEGGIYQGKW